jgi:hypothetical protein
MRKAAAALSGLEMVGKAGARLPHSKSAGAKIVCYNSTEFEGRESERYGRDEESK